MASQWWSKYLLVLFSFALALLLSIYPLPFAWLWWRPDFVLLVALYWVSVFPLTMSFLFLCLVGLFQDLLLAEPLGQHSMSMIIAVYVCMLAHRRVRNFTLWKEAGWIFILVFLAQIPSVWVQTLSGRPISGLLFFAPALSSALLWPLFRPLMERITNHYRIN